MKTPMQALIEWLESYEDSQFKPTYTNMKEKAWQLLPKEKQVIIDAYESGLENEYQYHINMEPREYEKIQTARQYFEETFNQKDKG